MEGSHFELIESINRGVAEDEQAEKAKAKMAKIGEDKQAEEEARKAEEAVRRQEAERKRVQGRVEVFE